MECDIVEFCFRIVRTLLLIQSNQALFLIGSIGLIIYILFNR